MAGKNVLISTYCCVLLLFGCDGAHTDVDDDVLSGSGGGPYLNEGSGSDNSTDDDYTNTQRGKCSTFTQTCKPPRLNNEHTWDVPECCGNRYCCEVDSKQADCDHACAGLEGYCCPKERCCVAHAPSKWELVVGIIIPVVVVLLIVIVLILIARECTSRRSSQVDVVYTRPSTVNQDFQTPSRHSAVNQEHQSTSMVRQTPAGSRTSNVQQSSQQTAQ